MKSIITLIAFSTFTGLVMSDDCNNGAIQGKLFPNATGGLEKCASETGFDVWAITEFPTKEVAKNVSLSINCVNYLNQINSRANAEIQCDITIGDTTKKMFDLLADILSGKTGNETASEEGSLEIEFPESDSGSKLESSTSGSEVASTPEPTSLATSTMISIASLVIATAMTIAL